MFGFNCGFRAFEHLIIESTASALSDFFELHAEEAEETITLTREELYQFGHRMVTGGARRGAAFVFIAGLVGALFGLANARRTRKRR